MGGISRVFLIKVHRIVADHSLIRVKLSRVRPVLLFADFALCDSFYYDSRIRVMCVVLVVVAVMPTCWPAPILR